MFKVNFCYGMLITGKSGIFVIKFCAFRGVKRKFNAYGKIKGADQPWCLCSLISTYVVRCLDSIEMISRILAVAELCVGKKGFFYGEPLLR